MDTSKEEALRALMQQLAIMQKEQPAEKSMADYKFWSTQPVPRLDETIDSEGPIEPNKTKEEIKKEPYALPKGYEWSTIDLNDEQQCHDVYELLTLNYVEDDDALFRFDYSAAFLKWALQAPDYKKDWHIGVRVSDSKKLMGFISGIPIDLCLNKNSQTMVEINFLCVHKKLRSKRLAPVLIKEVTRRVHLEGIFQAVYTAGTFLPKPVSIARYYHRNLNPVKLIDTGFSSLGHKMTMAKTIKNYKLPNSTQMKGFRQFEKNDVPVVCSKLNAFLAKFAFAPKLSEKEVEHWLLPRKDVVFSFVVQNEHKEITDFVSFYSLPSSVIKNVKYSHINAAYLFYYFSESDESLLDLVRDAMIEAQQNSFDVFNCLNIMNNSKFLSELKFGRGDGSLHYYLYNYKLGDISPEQQALVML